ncbi:MAG: CoA transferase [Bryobacteraceae bacterium]|nr:CoA transferase [Bryobacteraceae bacterium]
MRKVLDGIRIIDLGRFVSAPFGAQFLADWGAEVIKVEKPGGEPGRALVTKDGVSLYVPTFNRNKKGVTLETRSEEGKELLRKLIAKSDVLIENFVPGTMARMGLSLEEIHKINPRMIVASISGYGQKGPLAGRPVFDPVAQATSGLMSVTGTKESGPLVAGSVIIDHTAGLMMALGIMVALFDREHTGKGQYLDLSLVDCAIPFLQTYIPNYSANGVVAGLHGNKDLLSCPADTYLCSDGAYVYMHAGTQALYARLVDLINDDRLRDEKFATVQGRNDNQPELEEIVKEWFLMVTGAEAEAKLAAASVIGVEVSDIPRLFKSEQGKLRQQLVDMEVPGVGQVTFPANPIKLSDAPVEYQRAPTIGEHNSEVYGRVLGLSEAEIQHLSKIGAI